MFSYNNRLFHCLSRERKKALFNQDYSCRSRKDHITEQQTDCLLISSISNLVVVDNWEQVHSGTWLFLSLPGIRDLSKCPGRSCVNYGSSGASPESGIIIIIKGARPYTRVPPVSLIPLVSHLARNRLLDRFFGITRFVRWEQRRTTTEVG